jgi:polyhydroxyalkanoate synthesis regulator phasin
MDTWSKLMIDWVNSPAYAEAQGRVLDSYLSMSAPFREALQKAMAQILTQLNMPTRDDITALAERLTNIEFRLDDLDARLDALGSQKEQP